MRKLIFFVACLVSTAHGRRMKRGETQVDETRESAPVSPSKSLAMLLQAADPQAAFAASSSRPFIPATPQRVQPVVAAVAENTLTSSSEDLDALSATELKDKLKALGLKVSGKKAELVARLQEHNGQAEAAPVLNEETTEAEAAPVDETTEAEEKASGKRMKYSIKRPPSKIWKYAEGDRIKCFIRRLDSGKLRETIDLTTRAVDIKQLTPLEELKVGDEVDGKVGLVGESIAYVDIGASTQAKLLSYHLTKDKVVEDLRDELEEGECIKCRIRDVDVAKDEVYVSCIEDATPLNELIAGQEVDGKVLKVEEDFAFIDIGTEEKAILHVKHFSTRFVKDMRDELKVGDEIKCRIRSIDLEKQRVDLSNVEEFNKKFLHELHVGEEFDGKVVTVLPKVAFVDIGAEIDAALAPKDLSRDWLTDMNDEITPGQSIKCRIKDLKPEKPALAVTCMEGKMLHEFEVGDEVEGVIKELRGDYALVDHGAIQPGILNCDRYFGKINYARNKDHLFLKDYLKAGDSIKAHISNIHHEGDKTRIELQTIHRPLHLYNLGDEVEGRIDSVKKTYALVNIGAAGRAILFISEFDEEVSDLRDHLTVDNSIKARIHDINPPDEIVLTLKEKEVKRIADFKVGDEVQGKVVRVEPNYAFLDIGAYVKGLLHVQQFGYDPLMDMTDHLKVGDSIKSRVREVNLEEKKIRLTTKEDQKPLAALKEGEEVEGKIVKVTPQFAFVDIGAEKNGALFPDHLSQDAPDSDLAEQLTIGETIKCRIHTVDHSNGKIRVTCREGKMPREFSEGEKVSGTIVKVEEDHAVVDIGAITDATVSIAELTQEPHEGDTVTCYIKEAIQKDNKITVTCRESVAPLDELTLDEEVEGTVTRLEQNYAVVDIGAEIEGNLFPLPKELAVGDKITCRIREVNLEKRFFSLTETERRMLDELSLGEEVEGTIVKVEDEFALVDIGAAIYGRLLKENVPEDGPKLLAGNSVNCRISQIFREKQHIELTGQPGKLPHEFSVGDVVDGMITKVTSNLAHVEVGATSEAILSLSEYTDRSAVSLADMLAVGDTIECRIKAVEDANIRITCRSGIIIGELNLGEEVEGTIVKLKPTYAIVDIGAQVNAQLHLSQM